MEASIFKYLFVHVVLCWYSCFEDDWFFVFKEFNFNFSRYISCGVDPKFRIVVFHDLFTELGVVDKFCFIFFFFRGCYILKGIGWKWFCWLSSQWMGYVSLTRSGQGWFFCFQFWWCKTKFSPGDLCVGHLFHIYEWLICQYFLIR